ncbi:MAG: hypothetical protein WCC57_06815 [Paracoccaceae bacterium]
MVIGMVFAGVLTGAISVAWSISVGLPMLLVLLMYPAAGVVGSLAFITLAMMRTNASSDFQTSGLAQDTH